MLAVGNDGVMRLDVGNDVFEQIVLERFSPRTETAAPSAAPTTEPASATGVGVCCGITIGEDNDHRLDLLVGNQIIENNVGNTPSRPLLSLVAADAVQHIELGILLVRGIAGRRVDLHPPLHADGFGIVVDPLELAFGDAFARLIKSLGRRREGRFVVRAKHDRAAKPATTTASAATTFAAPAVLAGGLGSI